MSEHDCCGGSGGDCGVGRRSFMKAAGAGMLSLSVAPAVRASASACGAPATQVPPIRHFVPADKGLSASWRAALTRRGERRVYRGRELESIGMPIGGIAAGQLYLCGDGTLGCWQLFNESCFSGWGKDNYALRRPRAPVDQGFAVVIEQDAGRSVRRLDREGFEAIEFTGEHPIGVVSYRDGGSPVAARLEAFSPFIPLNASDSALPATIFRIGIENVSSKPMTVALRGWLENAVCCNNAGDVAARRTSRLVRGEQRTMIVHAIEAEPQAPGRRQAIVLADFEGEEYAGWTAQGAAFGARPARGTAQRQQPVSGFLGQGLVNTYLGDDVAQGTLISPPFKIERDFVNFLVGGGGHEGQTCVELLIDGAPVRTASGRNEELLRWHAWDVRDLAGRSAVIRIVDAHSGGWGHINVDHIELSDSPRRGLGGPLAKLPDFGTMALAMAGAAAPADSTGAAMVSEGVTLEPGAGREFVFVLSWHFPNGANGHRYATRFADAPAVAGYVLDDLDRLTDLTRRWHETYYGAEGTLPHWLLERIHSTVGNLSTGTCQWWANGRFWAWEGVGCCHGTCTHVWNYAHALARLFPELERSAREMQDLSAALHDSGLVGFRGERNGAYAADGQAGTVLKCWREHLMSADDAFLRRNWPAIRSVLLYSIAQDGNQDGLIESAQHNTFDIDFHGANTFVGSLYLAALRAGEEMARLMGDGDLAAKLRRIFESGRRLSVERLFTGEYFGQQVSLDAHPSDQYGQGCLSDQLFGQGWARQVSLGDLYPPEKTRAALQAIWTYNWAPDVRAHNEAHPPERWFAVPGEAGLFTCTWPASPHLDQGVRYRDEVWTGTEYQVAGHMAWEGMVGEALAIVRGIDERYDASKRNPYNEVECGDHYARALASWGVLLGLCGFEYDGPRGHLGFAPRLTPERFAAPFTAAEGWGTIAQERDGLAQRQRIEVRYGRLRLATMAFEIAAAPREPHVTVTAAGRALDANTTLRGTRLEVALAGPVVVGEGEVVEVGVTFA